MEITRDFVQRLRVSLDRKTPLINVVVGPRQVGKTTGVKQLFELLNRAFYYVSADGDLQKHPSWITEQWVVAKSKSTNCILIIDEIQKVENWSEAIKKLWDEQDKKKDHIRLILLGSSSLQIQQGLSESLAGRFFLHRVYHWDAAESKKAFELNLEDYLRFGGYPASYEFCKDKISWLNYVQNSIIDTVIGKDILSLARVKSPSLFKQCFLLATSYAGQEISYTKLLGQLQDKGNTELVKHYLELFEQAFLVKQIFKYSGRQVLARSSSPKILPLCPALYSVTLGADFNSENYGRSFEIMIGMMLNQLPGELYYWRQRNLEVDYVYKFGKKLWAIEVKWAKSNKTKALHAFKENFKNAELVLINKENYNEEIEKILSAVMS